MSMNDTNRLMEPLKADPVLWKYVEDLGFPSNPNYLTDLNDSWYNELAEEVSERSSLLSRVDQLHDGYTDILGWSDTGSLARTHRWDENDVGKTFLIRCKHEEELRISVGRTQLEAPDRLGWGFCYREVTCRMLEANSYRMEGGSPAFCASSN